MIMKFHTIFFSFICVYYYKLLSFVFSSVSFQVVSSGKLLIEVQF